MQYYQSILGNMSLCWFDPCGIMFARNKNGKLTFETTLAIEALLHTKNELPMKDCLYLL